jgi:hypothetical protein
MQGTWQRRQVLGVTAGTIATLIGAPLSAFAQQNEGSKAMNILYAPASKGIVTGKGRGDFDFLAGNWAIRHHRLKNDTADEWVDFRSSATVHRVLDGIGSVEELRNPDGSALGMGVRVWLAEQKVWADHWTSAANGVVNPPQLGRFIDGEGVFTSEETVDGVAWIYRGVWDEITPRSCRWHQSSSRDGGQSWAWNWWMEWERV